MAEKDTIFKGRIKQEGIYNFKDFYEFLYDYFTDENYDIAETKYQEKHWFHKHSAQFWGKVRGGPGGPGPQPWGPQNEQSQENQWFYKQSAPLWGLLGA